MIKIMIADDQTMIRESLKIIVGSNPDFEVVSLAGNGEEVLDYLKNHSVDVILMDIRMPKMDGVTCTKLVKKYYPNIRVIVLTTFDDDEYIYNSLKFGASGYLLKGMELQELTAAIYTVLDGGAIIHPKAAKKVFDLFAIENNTIEDRLECSGDIDLINRTEWRVIESVSAGLSNREIAQTLHFSEGTVRNYLSTILEKLHFRDRTQLAIWYIQSGKSYRALRD